ncbi:MAG TPA: fatty acid desaturase, partial [Sphingobium sp.]
VFSGVVAMLALYRAASFIHELTHIRKGALPGFRLGWNLLVGIPLMIPSFMYEGVHTQHHARTRYGTVDDPEYLPLALMKPWTLPLFIVIASLAPVGVLLRFGVLAPLSLIIPPLRRVVLEKYSALSINPAYRRRAPEGAFRRQWLWQEAGASVFALALMGSVFLVGWKSLLVYLAVHSGMTVINQLRTLVAHLWENEGEAMTVTAQYLDSVNVPPPSPLAAIWAPVGLRYHALHHLLPSVPYHALGKAHARLMATLEEDSPYLRGNYTGMWPLVGKIARSTMGRG